MIKHDVAKRIFSLIFLGLSPILWFKPRAIWLMVAVVILFILWWGLNKTNKIWLKTAMVLTMLALVVMGGFISSEMYIWGSGFNQDRFFWEQADFKNQIFTRENEAMYMPYRLRVIVYKWPIVVNYWLGNAFGLVKINNLIGIVGILNIFPLIYGLICVNKDKWLVYGWLTVATLVGAMNRMPDKSNTFYLALPVLVYLIYIGWKRIINVK